MLNSLLQRGKVWFLLCILFVFAYFSQRDLVSDVPASKTGVLLQHQVRAAQPLHLFIASAHVLGKNSSSIHPYKVVLNTMCRDTSLMHLMRDRWEIERRFRCVSELQEIVPTAFTVVDGHFGCPWKNYFLTCEFQLRPNEVSLMDQQRNKVQLDLTPPVVAKQGLVVCMARAFYFENWQVLLTALHVYQAVGVSQVSMALISILKTVMDVLRFYEADGFLQFRAGFLLPKVAGFDSDPNQETDSLNFMMSSNECLFQYRDSADFLIFSDADDVILPQGQDLYAMAKGLLRQSPLACSFEFLWRTSEYQWADTPPEFSVSSLLKSIQDRHNETYGKSVVVPTRLHQALVHGVRHDKQRVWPFENVFVDMSDGFSVHLRAATNSSGPSGFRFMNGVVEAGQSYDRRVQTNADFRKAVHNLPSTLTYRDALVRCFKAVQDQRDRGNDTCPSLDSCALSLQPDQDCYVLHSDFVGFTHRRTRIHVYMPRNRAVRLDRTCHYQLRQAHVVVVDAGHKHVLAFVVGAGLLAFGLGSRHSRFKSTDSQMFISE